MNSTYLKEAVITTSNVLSNKKDITLILLGEDGIFCFLDDEGMHDYSGAKIVSLKSILEIDPSTLNIIREMNIGELACRLNKDSEWIISDYIESSS